MSLINAFDLLSSCYVYGCIVYISVLFVFHVYCSLSVSENAEDRAAKATEPDFYTQVKDLVNPATEPIFATNILQSQPSFGSMTIKELRTYIKDNQLQKKVDNSIGKAVFNARKHELICTLI